MSSVKIVVLRGIGFLLISSAAAANAGAANFDFYVLVLSWSPDYCAAGGAGNSQQCAPGRKLGFVLHGLWPQYRKGYPADCTSEKLPAAVRARYSGLYPGENLIVHEWEKHGTCSGLTPEQYLSLSRKLKESVVVPAALQAPAKPLRMTAAQFKDAFTKANAGLGESALAVFCSGSGRFLREMYVCYSRDGKPVACSQEILSRAARSCGRPDFLIRNVR